MKEITFPSQINKALTDVLKTLIGEDKPSTQKGSRKESSPTRQNRQARKEFFYYTPLIDNDTLEIVGHLSDISTGGFKLDSQSQIPANKDFRFLMNLTSEVADKPFMVFAARSKWCRVDPLDPYIYNVGFQLISISPENLEIFNRMMEKYGRDATNVRVDLRRSNKW